MPRRQPSAPALVLLAALAGACQAQDIRPADLVLIGHAAPEAGALRIDTRTSDATWNACALTAPGVLAPGRSYTARVTCRIDELGDDACLLLLVRPVDANDHFSDLATAQHAMTGRERTLRLRFTVPAGRDDYALQIHTRRRLSALISALTIAEGGDVTTPVEAAGPAAALPPLPTGAEDFIVETPPPATAAPVSVADFGADPAAADNVVAFNRAIAHCKETGAKTLVVPTGTYRFTSDAPIAFTRLEDFTCDGGGSTFVFRKARNSLVQITACRRSRFTGFAIDWDWEADPLASIVRAEAVAAEAIDFRFVDHRRFPRRDVRVADIEELDPATMSVGCEGAINAGFEFFRGRDAPRTEWLGDDLLRVRLDGDRRGLAGRIRPGTLFRMRHYVYDMVGVEMRDNVHLTLDQVHVRSCPSHAFLSDGDQHHWQLLRCDIVPPTGVRRPITCTADHHHIGRSQGYLRMQGCEFSLGGDDCLNVHDNTGFAVRADARTLRSRNLRAVGGFHPGDPIELRHDDYAPSGFTAPLAAIRPIDIGAGIYELVFAQDLPAPTGDGFVLFNRRYGSRQVIVRDCFFHDNRARGLLLLGSDMTIANNRFVHNQMGAIKIETGYTFDVWSEGYGASNIVIWGNRFEAVNPIGAYRNEMMPAIYLSTYLRTDPSIEKAAFPILHDILIEGNAFVDGPGAIAYVSSARDVVIRGNTIEQRSARREEVPWRGGIGIAWASGVFITGNTWLRSPLMPAPAVRHDPDSASGVHCWGNALVEAPTGR